MGMKGMLLVGHGSTMPYNQELVEKTAAIIKAQNTGFIVKCGFMNMNKPSIKESLEEFRHEQIDALVVVPLFLAKGVHIEKDIPGEIGLPEGQKKGTFAMNGKSIPLAVCRTYRKRPAARRPDGQEREQGALSYLTFLCRSWYSTPSTAGKRSERHFLHAATQSIWWMCTGATGPLRPIPHARSPTI